MRIHEVCNQCGLTGKAVEYYERQGLLRPGVDENGYRNYTGEDVKTLARVAALRKLDISVPQIKAILFGPDRAMVLEECRKKLERDIRKSNDRLECLQYLCERPDDIDGAAGFISRKLDGSAPIADRLSMAFPGVLGKLLRYHFGRFLCGGIDSAEKAAAYAMIVDFLDRLDDAEFPADVEAFLDEALGGAGDDAVIHRIADGLLTGVGDFDAFMREHRDVVERYLAYRESPEYRNSPANRMRQALDGFFKSSGYYDVFIPNMKVLSDSYREYSEKIQEVNARFLREYPQAGDLTDV